MRGFPATPHLQREVVSRQTEQQSLAQCEKLGSAEIERYHNMLCIDGSIRHNMLNLVGRPTPAPASSGAHIEDGPITALCAPRG